LILHSITWLICPTIAHQRRVKLSSDCFQATSNSTIDEAAA
uniref:DUF4408 domain-containing protein n=1 Tax=Rodentolepis nana TaxID=102285 RepID=A0A0R3THF4_RODNA